MAVFNMAGAVCGVQLAVLKGSKFIRVLFIVVVSGLIIKQIFDFSYIKGIECSKKRKLFFQIYTNSNLGIISSFLKHYQVTCSTPSIPELDQKLSLKNYRNIVFFLIDAMGARILEKNLPGGQFSAQSSLQGK